jgi:hypothetical protein
MVGTADRSELGMYRVRVDGGSSRRVPVDSAEIARQEGEPGMGGLLLYIGGLSALVCRQV